MNAPGGSLSTNTNPFRAADSLAGLSGCGAAGRGDDAEVAAALALDCLCDAVELDVGGLHATSPIAIQAARVACP
jgi:hypothetical protein